MKKELSREDVRRELAMCESRLDEMVKSGKGKDHGEDLEKLGGELKSCRLELGKLEHRSDDEWEEAKHGIVRRLSEVRRSLDNSARRGV